MVAEWVALRPVFKVCAKETGIKGRGEGAQAVLVSDSRITAADNHARRDFGSSKGIGCSMNLAGVVRTREGLKESESSDDR